MAPATRILRRLPFWGTALVVMLAIWPRCAETLDPDRATSQYLHRAWAQRDGLPQTSISAIMQTPEGYLWLGTRDGLARFDGTKLEHVPIGGATANAKGVRSLAVSTDGVLWVGTEGGVGSLRENEPRWWRTAGPVMALAPSPGNRVWVGVNGDGLWALSDDRLEQIIRPQALPGRNIHCLFSNSPGELWMGTDDGLVLWDGKKVWRPAWTEQLRGRIVFDISAAQGGGLWIATDGGLFSVRGTDCRPFKPLGTTSTQALLLDSDDNLWIGTLGKGVYRLNGGGLARFGTPEGLSNDFVRALLEDYEHSLWIGTSGGGLDQLYDGSFINYTPTEGLPHPSVLSLLEDASGRLLAGTDGGGLTVLGPRPEKLIEGSPGFPVDSVCSLTEGGNGLIYIGTDRAVLAASEGGHVRVLGTPEELPRGRIRCLALGPDGSLWAGTGSGVAHLVNGSWRLLTADQGIPANDVTSLALDPSGVLWIGTRRGLARLEKGSIRTIELKTDGPPPHVTSLRADPGIGLWVTTSNAGLFLVGRGATRRWTNHGGLPDAALTDLVDDRRGRLWFTTHMGVFSVEKPDLLHAEDASGRTLKTVRRYDTRDGMVSAECTGGGRPGAILRQDGSLCFATNRGISCINPSSATALPPPKVLIREVLADGRRMKAVRNLRLEPGTRRIELLLSSLSFRSAGRNLFRYRLDGVDQDWVEREEPTSAIYTNLPPGSYTFRLNGRSRNGAWSRAPAQLTFTLAPHFYQTTWFLLLFLAAVAGLGPGIYGLRIQALKRRERLLEQLVADRTRKLEKANKALQEMSFHDGLTGLANFRYLMDALDRVWAQSVRNRSSMAVLMVDIDHFKPYNDTYGHLCGDDCLRGVAAVLKRSSLRPGDLAARYGGEEFVLLLPSTEAPGATQVAERIRAEVEELEIPHTSSPTAQHVTVSVGVAAGIPRTGDTPQTFIEAADRALYVSKNSGRNRVTTELQAARSEHAETG